MSRVLVAFATKHGSTREVAEAVADALRGLGHDVDVLPAGEVGLLRRYDAVVLGTALYAGRPLKEARRFLARNHEALAGRTFAVFAMGPASLDPKEVASSRKQLDRALAKVPGVVLSSVAVFGGVIDPSKLRFPANRMPAADARDWEAIEAWAGALGRRLVSPVQANRS